MAKKTTKEKVVAEAKEVLAKRKTKEPSINKVDDSDLWVTKEFIKAEKRFLVNQKAIYETNQRLDRIKAAIMQSKSLKGL